MSDYQIINTNPADLPVVYWLFEEAIAYQKRNNYIPWNGFDKDILQQDIDSKRQYKIVINREIVCIFSVLNSDPFIWQEKEDGRALYIHRVVVNPAHHGQNHFKKIVTWVIDYALSVGKKSIRMDTWGDNPKIIEYYKKFGFRFIEFYTTGCQTELAVQNRNLKVALLEMVL